MKTPEQTIADFERASELLLTKRRVPLPQKRELQAPALAAEQTPTQAVPHPPEKSAEQRFQDEMAESKRLQIERDRAEGFVHFAMQTASITREEN